MLPGNGTEDNQCLWEEHGALPCHPVQAAKEVLFSFHSFVPDKSQINQGGPGGKNLDPEAAGGHTRTPRPRHEAP